MKYFRFENTSFGEYYDVPKTNNADLISIKTKIYNDYNISGHDNIIYKGEIEK